MDANIPSGLPGIDLPASHSGIYLRLPLARLLCHFKAAVFVMPILLSLFTPTPAQAKAKKDPGKASIDKSGWHGWYWPTDPAGGPTLYDKNGPLSKFDAFVGLDDARGARSYEEKHDGAKGATWWGHCDPWSASSINQAQPTTPHAFNAVALGVGDQKGLITEYYDDNAGSRHGHIISGSSKPAVVWKALQQYVRDARTAIVFELNPGQQVWNHPVYRYEVEYQPAPTPSAPDRHRCNLRIWAKRDVISPDFVDLHDEKQTFSFGKYSGLAVIERQYDFEVDVKNGVPVVNTGTWTSMDHPDFVWVSRRGYFSSNKELIKEVVDFVVYGGKLIVDNPTTETPAQAGDVKHPQPIDVDIRLQTQQGKYVKGLKNKDIFEIKIGEKPASVKAMIERSYLFGLIKTGIYRLKVEPPEQAVAGTYDLVVKVGPWSATNIRVTNGVKYGSGRASVALVLDRSGSMGTYGYMEPAKNTAKVFVDQMKLGDEVAVVSFSSTASVNQALVELREEQVRTAVKSAIAGITSGGMTSIGAGLQAGNGQLTRAKTSHRKAMIILSDGYENTAPYVSSVLGSIPSTIPMYTIALGTNVDEKLLREIASSRPGGKYYISPTPATLAKIYADIAGAISGGSIFHSFWNRILSGAKMSGEAPITSSTSMTEFSLSWPADDPYPATLGFTLTDPNNRFIDPDVASKDPNITFRSTSTSGLYEILAPVPGTWKYTVIGTSVPPAGTDYTVVVSGRSDLHLKLDLNKDRHAVGEPIKVMAMLWDGTGPVRDAKVQATVGVPTFSGGPSTDVAEEVFVNGDLVPCSPRAGGWDFTTTLTLHDDGLHDDGAADDGVYAAWFKDTIKEGSYSFNATAAGVSNAKEAFRREAVANSYVSGAPSPALTVDPEVIDFKTVAMEQEVSRKIRVMVDANTSGPAKIIPHALRDAQGEVLGIPDVDRRWISPGQGGYADLEVTFRFPDRGNPGTGSGSILVEGYGIAVTVPITFNLVGKYAPTARATASPGSGRVPLTVKFTGEGTDPDGKITGYSWDFDDSDGIGVDSTEQNPTHVYKSLPKATFAKRDPYVIATLTVKDNDNLTGRNQVRIVFTSFPALDVTSLIGQEYANVTYNRLTRKLAFDMTLANLDSKRKISAPIVLVFSGLDPRITVSPADGKTMEGDPYVDFSSRTPGGKLDPGKKTEPMSVIMHNPHGVRPTFKAIVLAARIE